MHELKHAGPFLYFSPEYHALTAEAQHRLGELEDAADSMEWALWLDSDNAQYYVKRARIHRALSARDEYRARELGYDDDRRRWGFRGRDFYDHRGHFHGEYEGRHGFDEVNDGNIMKGRRGGFDHYDFPGDFDDHDRRRDVKRWEDDDTEEVGLWDHSDPQSRDIDESDRAWMKELNRLADTVREQQSSQRSWASPRTFDRYLGEM